jgi:post-segregation antitoxin (ccd killing protein)
MKHISDLTETLVPLNVRITVSQKEKMKELNLNLSAFTRSALEKMLKEVCK